MLERGLTYNTVDSGYIKATSAHLTLLRVRAAPLPLVSRGTGEGAAN